MREYPLHHGYDEFLGFCAHGFDYFLLTEEIEASTPDPRGHSAALGPLMHNRGRKEFKEGYLTEVFTDAAIEFLGRNQDKPFYLTLSYNAVHHLVHQVPKRYLDTFGVREIPNYDPETDGSYQTWFKRFITLGEISDEDMRKYYLANLNCLDDNIGRVLDALEDLSLLENTLVVFFSDNGGPPSNGAWNLPLAGSKFTLWEGGIRVPFILSRPGDPCAGEIWDNPISALDVTLLESPCPKRSMARSSRKHRKKWIHTERSSGDCATIATPPASATGSSCITAEKTERRPQGSSIAKTICKASVCLTCGKTRPRVAIWPKSIRRSFSVSRTGIPCGWNNWLDLSGRVEELNKLANKTNGGASGICGCFFIGP